MPTGADIVAGQATISQAGNSLNVHASTSQAIVNWDSFSVGAGNIANFNLPDANSAILNRVTSANMPSTIAGMVNSNGHVYLVNPSGIVVSSSGMVNTNGFTASTFDIANSDFMAGGALTFADNGSSASIVNNGTINTGAGGAHLIANQIANNGTITSSGGNITLSGGGSVTLDNGVTYLQPSLDTLASGISPTVGLIQNTGTIRATGAATSGGEVYLVNPNGNILHDGTIVATKVAGTVPVPSATLTSIEEADGSRSEPATLGGRVQLEADAITLTQNSLIDARGMQGGGEVLVGGDLHGGGAMTQATTVTMEANKVAGTVPVPSASISTNPADGSRSEPATLGERVQLEAYPTMTQATTVTMEAGATIDASAIVSGDGGNIVLWSDVSNVDSVTKAFGTLLARAGELFGDGGFVETSGHHVDTSGIAVDAGAANGVGGLWLIDPYNYVINSTAANNIVSALNTGTSVTVQTTANNASYGSTGNIADPGDITVASDIVTGAMSGDATLTLMAERHIVVNAPNGIDATQNGNTNKLNVHLWADTDNSTDGINIVSSPTIATNGGWFKTGNGATTSIGGVSTKVGGDIYLNGTVAQTIDTAGGAIDIQGETIVANSSVSGVTFDSGGGNIVFGGVLNSGNQYTYVDGPDGQANSWDWARNNAKNGTAGGSELGDSYMVTISSRLENAIAGIAAGYRGAWIGAYRDTATPNDWIWADGPEAGQHFFTQSGGGGSAESGWYSNFGAGEPNGSGAGGETRGQFFGTAGQWNDLGSATTFAASQASQYSVLGYVRETNLTPTAVTVNAGTGTVTFGGGVGGGKALASLTATADAGIHINGGQVSTEGIQTYNSPVLLGAHTNFSTIQNDIIFASTVDSDSASNQWNLTATITPGKSYYWVDWINWDEATKTATGTITVGSDVINVTYYNPQGINLAQTSGGTNFWTGYLGGAFAGASPYVSSNVANDPSTSDIIQLRYGGSQTLTFSQSVENLAFSVVSMNGNGYGFDQDFTIEGNSGINGAGPGYYGSGTFVKSIVGNTFQLNDGGANGASVGGNSEPHGTIRFGNAFSSLTWNSLSNELWNGFTVGVSGTSSTAGSVQFNGLVGDIAGLGTMTVNGAAQTTADIAAATSLSVSGLASLGGNITTSGNQSFGSAVTLGTDLTLTTTANGSISTTSTLDGAHDLTIETAGTGDVTFSNAVGGVNALTGLTITTDQLNAENISLAANAALSLTNGGTSAITGVISGTDATLSKAGTGTLTLSGTNTFSGSTTINAGTLSIASDANLGTAPSSSTAGHLTLDGGTLKVTSNTTLSSNRGIELGDDDGTIEVDSGITIQYAGIIVGAGDLTKTGAGKLLVSGASTYTGATQISGGVVETNNLAALGDKSALTLDDTAGVSLNLLSHLSIGSLAGGGTTGGNVSLGSSKLTAGENNTSTTFAGVISGTGILDKTGSGVFTLTANNNYTGATTIGAGQLILENNAPTFATSSIDGPGSLTIRSASDSFSAAFNTSSVPFGVSTGLGGLTIGKTTNTADITIGSASSVNGAIEIYGGNIAINGGLTATGSNTITIGASGNVTDGASGFISADSLLIEAAGTTTLDSNSNAIGTFAFDGGIFALTESNGLTVGTVGSTSGINATGTVNVSTLAGDLTVSQNITTSDISAAAITLNAGRSTAVGTTTGGNIVFSGSPTITTGTGGRATLFTGSVAGSTGLTDLIGSGSGNFRYNSDESASNYSLALGTGLLGIYREQPTINVSVADATITYGDSTASLAPSVSNAANGDSVSQIFASSSIAIGGTSSTSGNPIVGDHTLTSSGTTASQLGYAIGTNTGGTLTVNQKQITTPLVIDNKEYDATTAATFSASANGAISGDVIDIGGTATFVDKNVGTAKTVNITGLNLTGTDAGNYVLATTTDTSTADITVKSITVSGLTASDKIYDATTTATIDHTGVMFTGMIGGDDLTASSTTGTFADKNVGTAKTVTLSGTSYGGADVNNYTFVDQTTTTADISQKSLTISAMSGVNREYDGTTAATVDAASVQLSGILFGDVVTIADVIGTFADKNVGDNKTITITASTLGGTDLGNYSITNQATATADITPRSLTISGLTAADKVYDATTVATVDATGVNYGGLIGGDSVSIDTLFGTFSDKNVGTAKTVTIASTYTGTDVGNYAITDQTTTTASISTRAATILGLTANNRVYDSTTAATLSGTATANSLAGDDVTVETNYIANFATKDVGNGQAVTVSGYSLSGTDASNYSLTQPTGFSADITPAPLTITANHDSKFVTKSDVSGYAGASYQGFVGSEGIGDLSGALAITRSGSDEAAGLYSGVLMPSGLTSTNYAISYINGDYTIVPAEQFLIRFGNSNSTYGNTLGYNFLSAEYMDAGNVVSSLTPNVSGNDYSFNDGVGGTATFTVGLENPTLSTSGHANAGTYDLAMSNLIAIGGNFNDNLNLFGTHIVDRLNLTIGASGVSKTYDGTVSMNNLSLSITGLVPGDNVGISGQGSYANRNAGTGLSYNVSNLLLSGADANDYVLPGGASLSGTDGTIVAKSVHITAPNVTKVYDGNTGFTATATQLQDWTTQLGVAGDTFDGITLTYDNKNVGTGKTLTPSSLVINDGNGGGNYNITLANDVNSAITRLGSVMWIGGATGDWNDPANWAGGAVPDLANVANVIIPLGVTPTFGTNVAGPVQLDSFSGGNLLLNGGTLDVSSTFAADTLTQNSGTLNANDLTVQDFTQNGGGVTVGNDFTVTNSFVQGPSGTIGAGGHVDITNTVGTLTVNNITGGSVSLDSTNGGVHVVNLQANNGLGITANGDVTQSATGTFTVGGTATIGATGDIVLDGANNDFAGPVNLNAVNVTVNDSSGGLQLGTIVTTGEFNVSTTGGSITQSSGSQVSVGGVTTLTADGDIDLRNGQNRFTGPVNLAGNNAELAQTFGDLVLGTVTIVNNFWADVASGKLSQSGTGAITIGGNTTLNSRGPMNLSGAGNNFQGSVKVNAPLYKVSSLTPFVLIKTGAALGDEVALSTNSQTVNDVLVRPSRNDATDTDAIGSVVGWVSRFSQFINTLTGRVSTNAPAATLTPANVDQSDGEVRIR